MSGSPVVDKDGQMVGLLRGAYVDERPIVFEFREKEMVGSGYVFSRAEAPASGMAMALPSRVVEYVASEIREKGKVARGWLGVRIIMNDEKRVEIIEVEKDSPAELAQLEKDDIVLKFDGQDIENTEALAHMIRMRKPGESVTITVERDGKVQDVDVILGEYTEEDAREEFERKFPRLFSRPEREFRVPEKIEPEIYRWGFEQRKYIGVFIDELNEDLSKFFGVEEGKGLLIARIEKNSPAEKAGLKVGDVIIKADGNRVETTRELSELIQDKKKDDTITVEFLRDKKKQTVDVKVEEEEKSPNLFYGDAGEQINFWREYQGTLQDQYQRIQENYQKWQDVRAKEYERRIKSMNEELQRQLQKQREETQKSYKRVLSKYRGIRV
jgi:S1-C subfamily serine protease